MLIVSASNLNYWICVLELCSKFIVYLRNRKSRH